MDGLRYDSLDVDGIVKRALALVLGVLAGCAHAGQVAPAIALTDQHGSPWQLSAQRGKAVALFFGFTHCADTCPATIAKLTTAIRAQGAAAGDAEIAFVTIDPQRDTPAVLARYVSHFSGASIVGLSGPPAQIDATERAYHVWSQRIPGKHGGYDYDEAHTAVVFMIDRSGYIVGMADNADSLETVTADLRKALQ